MSSYLYAVLLFLMIFSSINAGEKICPGYGYILLPENCTSTCSKENDTCSPDLKCCFRVEEPCGYHCIVPKDNEPKPGICPVSLSSAQYMKWYLCDGHECDVDNDCKRADKCCYNACGMPLCIAPKYFRREFT
ncbi:unnamed protein product [Rotaria sp. Silwood2]|nr:unnamed protein product [Rotaria sp. Silwood2]CAF4063424.1 unnamed protein product [Rotaria sp. Silwood2]